MSSIRITDPVEIKRLLMIINIEFKLGDYGDHFTVSDTILEMHKTINKTTKTFIIHFLEKNNRQGVGIFVEYVNFIDTELMDRKYVFIGPEISKLISSFKIDTIATLFGPQK